LGLTNGFCCSVITSTFIKYPLKIIKNTFSYRLSAVKEKTLEKSHSDVVEADFTIGYDY